MFPIKALRGSIHFLAALLGGLLGLAAPAVGIGQEKKPEKAPVRYIGEVIIVGNTVTPDCFIRDQLNLSPGQVLVYPELKLAERNLARLGWFECDAKKNIRPTVQILDDGKGGPFYDILVKVQERPGTRLRMAAVDLIIFRSSWHPGHLRNAANLVRDEIRGIGQEGK